MRADAGRPDSGAGANRAPVATEQSLETDEDTPLAIALLADDPDGDGLSYSVVDAPTHGTLSGTAPNLTYAPDADFNGADQFTFKANDGQLDSAIAVVAITVVSVNDAPQAGTDHYATAGNTLLTVGSSGPKVLANDADAEGDPFAITAYDSMSAEGGTVTLNPSDGTFTYLPPPGFQGTDSFTYTITENGTPPAAAIGTVDISVSNLVWYVDNSGPNGSGRSSQPFNNLASAESASAASDVIFVHTGTAPYDGGIVLKSNQQLLGQGVGLAVLPNAVIAAGSAPTLTNSSGDAITLASNSLVRGLDVAGPSANAFAGNGIAGTTAIGDVRIASAGGAAISIINGGGTLALSNLGAITGVRGLILQGLTGVTVTDSGISISASAGPALDISNAGSLALTFDSLVSANSPGAGVRLDLFSGSVLVKSGTSVIQAQADGIAVTNASGASIELGNCDVRASGQSAGDGYAFSNNPGATIAFAMTSDPQTAHGRGLFASSSGTITIPSLPSAISATGGAAIDLRDTLGNTGGSGHWRFANLTSTASPGTGIKLQNLARAVEVTGTTNIVAATAESIRIDAVSGGLAFGSVAVSSRKHAGIFVDGAIGPSVSFGTLSIPNPNAAGQNALQIQNSSAVVTLAATNIDNATTGISLINNTGSFTLSTPGASAGQSGTLLNSTNEAISLTQVTNVTLDGLIIDGSGAHGISATNVSGFVFRNGRVQNAGTAGQEHAIALREVSGSVLLKDSVLTAMADSGLDLQNAGGQVSVTLDHVVVANNDANTFCAGQTCDGSGVRVRSAGNLSLDVLNGCLFGHIDGDGIDFETTGPNANMVVTIQQSDFVNSLAGDNAIQARALGGTLDFVVGANGMSDWGGHVISTTVAGDGLNVIGIIANNNIVANNVSSAQGIHFSAEPGSPADTYSAIIAIDANTVSNTNGAGIWLENRDANGSGGRVDATITNNVTMNTGAGGYYVTSRSGTLLCAHIEANSASNPGGGAMAYELLQSDASAFQLEGSAVDATTEIVNTNTGTPVGTSGAIAIVAPGTCLTPPPL